MPGQTALAAGGLGCRGLGCAPWQRGALSKNGRSLSAGATDDKIRSSVVPKPADFFILAREPRAKGCCAADPESAPDHKKRRATIGEWGRCASHIMTSDKKQDKVMGRSILCLLLISAACEAENRWYESRSGPIELLSDAPQQKSLVTLGEAEQLRFVLGRLLGIEDLQANPKVRLVIFKDARDASQTGATPAPSLVEGRDRRAMVMTAGQKLAPDTIRLLTRMFIERNTGRLPPEFERGLESFLTTLQVNGAHVKWGAPPANPDRDWARIALLATNPDYSGRAGFCSSICRRARRRSPRITTRSTRPRRRSRPRSTVSGRPNSSPPWTLPAVRSTRSATSTSINSIPMSRIWKWPICSPRSPKRFTSD